MTTIIALTGAAGAGKDTVAALLRDYARFVPLAFADALRAEVADAWGLGAADMLSDRATKEQPTAALALRRCTNCGFIGALAMAQHAHVNSVWLDEPRTPRQVLQWWGTEFRRAESPGYWTSQLLQRVRTLREQGASRLVVTDCRFTNELQVLRTAGAKLWRVQRAGLAPVEGQHTSATELRDTPADETLDNDGTVQQLRDRVLQHWWAQDINVPAWRLRVELQT